MILAGAVSADEKVGQQAFNRSVKSLLNNYCIDCHGPDVREGNLSLHDIDPDMLAGDDLERWLLVEEQLRFGEMPPPDEPQPNAAQLAAALKSIRYELLKTQRPGVVTDLKLLLPRYGNYVDHEALFTGPAGPVLPAAPRMWRMRPGIYSEFARQFVPERPKKVRKDGISRPFSVLPGTGFKDYASAHYIDEPATDLLLRNAELIVSKQVSNEDYANLRALVDHEKPPSPEAVASAIRLEFRLALRRSPTEKEVARFTALYRENLKLGGHVASGKEMLLAILMQPEVLFRQELGAGPVDQLGRIRLSQAEIAAALSYSLRNGLDDTLAQAATKRRLATREQVTAQVKGMLDQGVSSNPRLLQFFREYFGYTGASQVFKDRPANGFYEPDALVNDLDQLILYILRRDRNVLRELLTTPKVFVGYFVDPESGVVRQGPIMEHRRRRDLHAEYGSIYGLPADWRWTEDQPIELKGRDRAGVLTHPAWLVAWSGNFENHPVQRGLWVRTHLLGGRVPDVPIDVDARIPEDEHKTLRERLGQVSHASECWRCHRKMDGLGLPFELYDHYGRFRETECGRPVVASGVIAYTGVESLHGPVAHPVELAKRLAASEHVEQVFVRHAFRFFLGRNETLGDAITLRDAHRAYRNSGGSFRALVTSLLTSDSFLLRMADNSAKSVSNGTSD